MEHNVDFKEGTLLRFNPFWFPDGGEPKVKYFLVLHNNTNSVLLVSLPTSKDHIPSDIKIQSGCIELPERNFNAFVFKGKELVTDTFSFDVNTFIYGTSIHEYSVKILMQPILNKQSKVKVIGVLHSNIFKDLIRCLKSSESVKRKYKKIL